MAFEHFEDVRQSPNGTVRLRERKGDVKPLLEEVLPIARYVLSNYGQGQYIHVRWMRGNQPFDAKVETKGAMVDNNAWPASGTLEVTVAQHPNEYLMREILTSQGGAGSLDGLKRVKGPNGEKSIESTFTSYSNQSYIYGMATIVLDAIRAKAAKNYPDDTTLIVEVELNTVYLRNEWEKLIDLVRADRPSHTFLQVFLTADRGGYTAVL